MNVSVITTGDLEFNGIVPALSTLFPHESFSRIEYTPGRCHPGFTSRPLAPIMQTRSAGLPSDLQRIIAGATAEAMKRNVDGVIILEDLELENVNQPQDVVSVVRFAINAHLAALPDPRIRELSREALRSKVSIHFAVPMIEAWFFADPPSLARAGVPVDSVQVDSSPRFEEFQTNDPGYIQDQGSVCSEWHRLRALNRNAPSPGWLRTSDRRRHPKHYLQWLCRDPNQKSCTSYKETRGGVDALIHFDWQNALRQPNLLPYLSSMLDDLEKLIIRKLPFEIGRSSPFTCHKHDPNQLLRNM